MNPDTLTQVAKDVKNLLPNFLFSLWGLLIVAYIGMLTNFLSKKVTGETATAIVDYFEDHLKSTIISFTVTTIATVVLIAGFATGSPMDLVAVFLVGLGSDAILNKWQAQADAMAAPK